MNDFLYSMKLTRVFESFILDACTSLKAGELHLDLILNVQVSPSAKSEMLNCVVVFTLFSKVTEAVSPHLDFLNGQKLRA